jgi:hypothetical protein
VLGFATHSADFVSPLSADGETDHAQVRVPVYGDVAVGAKVTDAVEAGVLSVGKVTSRRQPDAVAVPGLGGVEGAVDAHVFGVAATERPSAVAVNPAFRNGTGPAYVASEPFSPLARQTE